MPNHSLRWRAAVSCAASALALGFAAGPAAAQTGFTKSFAGRVGAWKIGAVMNRDGSFSRCAADFTAPQPAGWLRFGYMGGSHYYMTWPGPKIASGSATAIVKFDRGYTTTQIATRGSRTAIQLDGNGKILENLFRANENITVIFDGISRTWPLYRVHMNEVFGAMEDCYHKYRPFG